MPTVWIVFAALMLTCMTRTALAQNAADIAGTWQGTVQVGKAMRVVLKISKGKAGLEGSVYCLDETVGSDGLSASSMTFDGMQLKFAIAPINAAFEGKLSADGGSITGKWNQEDESAKVELKRASAGNEWALPDPRFEVASIRPAKPDDRGKGFRTAGRRISCENETMNDIITYAYGLHPKQIVGGSDWFGTDKFDIVGTPDVPGALDSKQEQGMYRKLLADRFQLKFHHETRTLPVYVLTVGKEGHKLTISKKQIGTPDQTFQITPDLVKLRETSATLAEFAGILQGTVMDKPVVDQTGLTGKFDFLLRWTPDDSQFTQMGVRLQPNPDVPSAAPGLFTALQEELGLKLEPAKAPVDVLVIDHVERPSAN